MFLQLRNNTMVNEKNCQEKVRKEYVGGIIIGGSQKLKLIHYKTKK